MRESRTYPEGVPSWVEVEHRDVEGAQAFYGELFGWTFIDATPPDAPFRYFIAELDGQDVAGIAGPTKTDGPAMVSSAWNTYIAVDDAEATAARIEAAGGHVVQGPSDVGEGGRSATCTDPFGVQFGLWQARRRLTRRPSRQHAWRLELQRPARSRSGGVGRVLRRGVRVVGR